MPSVKDLADSIGIQNPFIMQLSEKVDNSIRAGDSDDADSERSETKRMRLESPVASERKTESSATMHIENGHDASGTVTYAMSNKLVSRSRLIM